MSQPVDPSPHISMPPPHQPSQPPSLPSAEVLQALPMWARGVLVIATVGGPLLGTAGGALAGGQAAAIERAVLATKVERIEDQLNKLEGGIDGLEKAFYSRRDP